MTYLSIVAKTLFGFMLLWAITRVLGKKQISQLSLFDYITGITIGSMVAELVSPDGQWKLITLGVLVWGALTYTFHVINLKGRAIHRLFDGRPTLVVLNGKILEENLNQLRLNLPELMSMLREKGHFNLNEVEYAYVETNGGLSVLLKSQYRPVQPRDLKLSTGYEGAPTLVMKEREVIQPGLQSVGLTEGWLLQELLRLGIDRDDVFAAWLATDGSLVVDRYQDQIH